MLNYRYNLKELLNTLENAGELDLFVTDIFRFNLICEETCGVKEILFDEHVAPESKNQYFQKVFANLVGENFKKFILQLIENNDLHFYEMISSKFVDLLSKTKNSLFVEVWSALDLTPEQLDTLRRELERLESKKVYLHNVVSKNVLGGFILKRGEKMLDLSVQAGLEQLKTALV
ncbi:F0F1 ATP synthase subunit delta [Candidatus Termititenax aidoneus]|uniref:ATP synthase subunit delta n=1 Tax=Termititenax aidoneus TaxID=2218524 RepID=A0A388T7K3_TERA1|nr:F0F1 ATP synthase subunit delta [Candidatus Termititenax aidoneus]